MTDLEFSRPISIDDVPNLGRTWVVTATPEECRALADRYGILDVEGLEAKVKVRPVGRTDSFKVEGTLTASVVQACVVSLEPVRQSVSETFAVVFAPEAEEGGGDGWDGAGELTVDLTAEDPPDPLVDGKIDLGEVVAEHLALALDPFPRAEGAEIQGFSPEPEPEQTVTNRPFAVLAEFRDKKIEK